MDPILYKAVQEGDLNTLSKKIKEPNSTPQLTPNKNSLLHVAAQFNNSQECATEILKTNESLLYEVNSDGETALHVAARNGMENVGIVMMEFAKRLDRELEAGGVNEKLKRLLTSKNIHGNTALHEAIRNNRPSMVNLMIKEDNEIANIANNAMETPLFLAVSNPVDKNLSACFDYIMEYCPLPAHSGPKGKTALHAVALYNRKGISQKLLNKHPTIITEVDDRGWSALHYAALHGSNDVAADLLKADKSIAYIVAEKDKNMTALHIATCVGNVKIMEEILAYCPDCWEMVTGDGRNILHLSVEFEQQKAFEFIMKESWVGNLFNQKDAKGNTPLHSCAETLDFFCGYHLVKHPQIEKNAVNKKYMTPLDVIMSSGVCSVKKDTVRKKLKAKGAVMSASNLPIPEKSVSSLRNKDLEEMTAELHGTNKIADTHILVAVLIATVAFAAGFTIPGGFDGNDGSNEGLAVLSRKAAFKAFIITDTLAMVCSASAVFLHFIGAICFDMLHRRCCHHTHHIVKHHDFGRQRRLYYYAANLVLVAMGAMVIAFMTGLYTVLEHSREIAIIECVICSVCLVCFTLTVTILLFKVKS